MRAIGTAGMGHNASANSRNWVAISRDMRDHPIVGFGQPVKPANPKRGSFSKGEAWMDLVMEARWRGGNENNKGKVIRIERGQLIAARRWLAERWNWTENTVRWFLGRLEDDLMISRNSDQSATNGKPHYANVVTIRNNDIFQAASEILEKMEAAEAETQPPKNHQSTTNQPPHLNKETIHTESPQAGTHDFPDGDFVKVNGEAIYVSVAGKRIKFEYGTIDYWGAIALVPPNKARDFVEAECRGWVADGKMPDRPSNWIQAQMTHRRTRSTIADIRVENEQKAGKRVSNYSAAGTYTGKCY